MPYAVAVDLGGTDLRVGLVGATGDVTAFATTATDSEGGPQAVIAQIVTMTGRLRAEAGP